ncbi:hypothetical protein LTR48_004379 [Friedmanniomyces endolithicus]|nr:hypothetical protein LTR48_004379 [Friedmanniomyces endolithicus]
MDNGMAKDLSVSQTRDVTGSIDLAASHQLERGLKSRHIQFIALGGAIGTGLFVGSGGILSTVGPAPLFMAYITMIFVVWVVMNDLAEMATYLPLKGISVPYFVERFVEPSLAFADAPRIFSRTTSHGVPYVAVLAAWLVACLAYLNVANSGAKVFIWFSNISTISGFIAWIVAMITYLRFRKAMQCKELLHTLPYRTPLRPYATYFVLGLVTILTLTNGFPVFFPANWNISDFMAGYITLPIFFVLYLGHKIWSSMRRVVGTQESSWKGGFWTFARKVEDVDVLTGKREMDEMEALDVPPVPRNWVEKVWFWLA